MLPYQKVEEIRDRYSGSIIYLGDEPIYCIGPADGQVIDHNGKFVAKELAKSKIGYTKLGSKAQDIFYEDVANPELRDSPFILGYINGYPVIEYNPETGERINVGFTAVYSARIPIRRWKQGITSENFGVDHARKLKWHEMLVMPSVRDMFMNKYPTYKTALKNAGVKSDIIAFHKKIAVGKDLLGDFNLYYRGKIVGRSDDGERYRLGTQMKYLKEFFEEQGVEVI